MTDDRNHSPADDAADARIDAIARSAGRELRRPAPANGIAKVQRARRTRQVTRAAGGGVAAIVLVAVGVVALNNRGQQRSDHRRLVVVTTQPQVSTTADPTPPATDPSTPPTPTSLPADSTTSLPTTSLPAAETPAAVYVASGSVADVDRVQTLIDPMHWRGHRSRAHGRRAVASRTGSTAATAVGRAPTWAMWPTTSCPSRSMPERWPPTSSPMSTCARRTSSTCAAQPDRHFPRGRGSCSSRPTTAS